MKPILIALLPLLLIGSSIGGEPERKARVQALIKQIADEASENRRTAYSELRDDFVMKRDIPELTKEIARNPNPGVKKSLRRLIFFMKKRWRLPDGEWTTDIDECDKRYRKAFNDLGYDVVGVRKKLVYRRSSSGQAYVAYPLQLHLDFVEVPTENRTGIIELILILEPESLLLWTWSADINFLATLNNLEMLDLAFSNVTDLTPVMELHKLRDLRLTDTKVVDLKPLAGLKNIKYLDLQDTGVTDLKPLEKMRQLSNLDLRGTKVTDLKPLDGLPKLQVCGRDSEGRGLE